MVNGMEFREHREKSRWAHLFDQPIGLEGTLIATGVAIREALVGQLVGRVASSEAPR